MIRTRRALRPALDQTGDLRPGRYADRLAPGPGAFGERGVAPHRAAGIARRSDRQLCGRRRADPDSARARRRRAVDEALVRKGLEFFLSYYREHKLDHTTVYPGIAEALAAIQNSANGVPRKMAVLYEQAGDSLACDRRRARAWGNSSRRFMAATASPPRSRIPRARANCCEENWGGPEQAAIVGDSHVDVQTGRNAGLWTHRRDLRIRSTHSGVENLRTCWWISAQEMGNVLSRARQNA